MYLKIHQTHKGKIIAACDEDLIGKIFNEGEKFLDLDRHKGFYIDRKVDTKELVKELKGNFNSANFVGEQVINTAIKINILSEEEVGYIQGIPYAQIYSL